LKKNTAFVVILLLFFVTFFSISEIFVFEFCCFLLLIFFQTGQEFISSNSVYCGLYEELNKVDPSEFASAKENKFFNSYSGALDK